MLSPGLAALIYALARASEGGAPGEPRVLIGLVAGVVLLAAFAGHALRRRDRALVDLRLFADRAFATSVGVLFCYSVAMFGALILVPLYVQIVRGGDTFDAGLLVAPLGAGAAVTALLVGRITARFGSRNPSVAGIVAVLAGLLVYTQVDAETAWPLLAAATFVMGLGHGVVTPLVMAGAYRDLPTAAIPGATVAATIMVRVGSAAGRRRPRGRAADPLAPRRVSQAPRAGTRLRPQLLVGIRLRCDHAPTGPADPRPVTARAHGPGVPGPGSGRRSVRLSTIAVGRCSR